MQTALVDVAVPPGNFPPSEAPPPLRLHKVTDADTVATLAAVLKDMACDDVKSSRFPGPNPVSLDTTHFDALRREPYYLCEKTDGVRFLLLCCSLPAHAVTTRSEAPIVNLVVLVDRALSFYLLPIQKMPKAMFQGSLLDGELAWNRTARRWDFLVFDAIIVSGIPVLNGSLVDRIAASHKALSVYAAVPAKDPVRLGIKTFVPCSRFGDVEAHLATASTSYEIDGVILTPAAAPVVYGRHGGMFKLKFGSRHTVDFVVGQDGRSLAVFDAGAHVTVGALRPEISAPPGAIAECTRCGDGTWNLMLLRTDKTTANDMFTYQKTLLNMREKLTIDHVRRLFVQL